MARKVTAWACEYRCGQKTTTHRADMLGHEDRCHWNPKNHACPTCIHDRTEYDRIDISPHETENITVRYCEQDKRPHDKNIVAGCEYWLQRESAGGA